MLVDVSSDVVVVVLRQIFEGEVDVAEFGSLRKLDHVISGVLILAHFAVEVYEILAQLSLTALENLIAVLQNNESVQHAKNFSGGLVNGGDHSHAFACFSLKQFHDSESG